MKERRNEDKKATLMIVERETKRSRGPRLIGGE